METLEQQVFEEWFDGLGECFDISKPDIFQSTKEAAEYIRTFEGVFITAEGGYIAHLGMLKDVPKEIMDMREFIVSFLSFVEVGEFFFVSTINDPELIVCSEATLVGEQGLLNWQIVGYSV